MAESTEHEAHRADEFAKGAPYTLTGDGSRFAIVPPGYSIESLERLQDRPNRIVASPVFYEIPSLADYVARYFTGATVATADWRSRKIKAFIDYHDPVDLDESEPAAPSHNDHQATFAATFGAEYEAWRTLEQMCQRAPLTQKAFGEFLEDRAVDVRVPDAADVMEMVMKFEVTRTAEFASSQKLSNGTRQIQFMQKDSSKGAVALPEQFVLEIPIYVGGDPVQFVVRIRYDIEGGALRFVVKIADREKRERDAFEQCETQFSSLIYKSTGETVPIYRGPVA